MDTQISPASRVLQLEATELDNEFHNTVDYLVDELGFPNISEELKVLLKAYLFLNHIARNATVGMKIYGMKFCVLNGDQNFVDPGRYKLAMLAACNLLSSYMVKRHRQFERLVDDSLSRSLKLDWLTIDNFRLLLRMFSILNFLIFLRKGNHITLFGNLSGLMFGMPANLYYSGVMFNKFQMDYMYRETIWRAISEFLFTVIPFIDAGKIKNRFASMLHLSPKLDYTPKLQDRISREKNMAKCAICEKQPFNPYVIGCKHVFCYYCLNARYLSDSTNGYVCLLCNYSSKDPSVVRRLNFYIQTTNTQGESVA